MTGKRVAPVELAKKAAEADRLFTSSWQALKEDTRDFGRACDLIETEGLFRFIPKTKKKCFTSFDDYVQARTSGECSRTFIFDAVRIHKLTIGQNGVPPEVADTIPKKNLLQLARVKPEKRTPELVEKAQKQNTRRFVETVQEVRNQDLPEEKRRTPMVHWHAKVHPRVAEAMDELLEDFKLLTGVVRDGDYDMDLDSKALYAIANAARSFAGDAIAAAKDKAAREAFTVEAQDSAEIPQEYNDPEAPQKIAEATVERRVIRNPEARPN